MKKIIMIAGLLIAGQTFAKINPTIMADPMVQGMLAEYNSGKDSILSLKITSPSAAITTFEIVFGVEGDSMRECRSVTAVNERIVDIGVATECN